MEIPAEPEEQVVFSDEDPSSNWEDYTYEVWEHPQVTALYSPWQQPSGQPGRCHRTARGLPPGTMRR